MIALFKNGKFYSADFVLEKILLLASFLSLKIAFALVGGYA